MYTGMHRHVIGHTNVHCTALTVGLTRTLRFNNTHPEARLADLYIHTDHAHRNTKHKCIDTETHRQCLHDKA